MRRAGLPSQRHRLPDHSISNQAVEAALLNDVNSSSQFVFKIGEEPPREERSSFWTCLDQQIQVAICACLTTSEGAKHTNADHAMLGSDRKDCIAFGGSKLVECHRLSAVNVSKL